MKQIRRALGAFIFLSIITGVIYPLLVMCIGKALFAYQANGSLITANGQVIGSELIGQNFTSDKYLWGRISATADYPYNALASGGSDYAPDDTRVIDQLMSQDKRTLSSGSNYAPSNPQLIAEIKGRMMQLKPSPETVVPIDLVTSSASGLDPEISIASAYFQMNRIAEARKIDINQVQDIINQYASYPFLGVWGEPRVNVLKVNLALDKIQYKEQS